MSEEQVPGFSWVIENKIAGMKFPQKEEDYINLKELGIGLVVCLNERLPNFNFKEIFPNNEIEIYHCPIDDYNTPKDDKKILEMLEKCNETINVKKKVAIHCMAGLSRTGMCLAILLTVAERLQPKEAIALVNKTRGKGKNVMTFKQEDYVSEFYTKYFSIVERSTSTINSDE
ncbi:hypothetical protein ABK040_002635 [Willaertia magna]